MALSKKRDPHARNSITDKIIPDQIIFSAKDTDKSPSIVNTIIETKVNGKKRK
jgi:hypothetical protein